MSCYLVTPMTHVCLFRCKQHKHWMKDDNMPFILGIEKYGWENGKAFQNILFSPKFHVRLKVTLNNTSFTRIPRRKRRSILTQPYKTMTGLLFLATLIDSSEFSSCPKFCYAATMNASSTTYVAI